MSSTDTISSDSVDSCLAIHYLRERVGGCAVAGIVDEDVVSTVSLSQNPMSSVVHVQDDYFSFVEFGLDLAVADFSFVDESEGVDGSPDEEIATDISSVGFEPGVESGRIVSLSDASQSHGG